MTPWLSGIQSSMPMDTSFQIKHESLLEDQPNLNKSGSFCLQMTTELDAYDDPNYPTHDINKRLEEVIAKNN